MKYSKQIILIVLCLSLCSCSSLMALSGKPDTNLGIMRIGMDRETLMFNWGQPIKTSGEEAHRFDYFKTTRGNAPSVGRAAFHGVMDLLTFGGWEVIGVPAEALSSSSSVVMVEYNNDKVVKFQTVSEEDAGL